VLVSLSTNIYSANTGLVNRIRQATEKGKSEFRADTDPSYIEFSGKVQAVAREWLDQDIKNYKLQGLWSKSKNFHTHWQSTGAQVSRQMAWTAFHYSLAIDEVGCLVLAWMHSHGRYPSDVQIAKEIGAMTQQVLKDVQPSLKAQRDRKNRSKRQRRGNHMKGRPKDTSTDSTRNRILAALQNERSTPGLLAVELRENVNTVSSQLRRMLAEGIVYKPSDARGVYELVQSDYPQVTVQAVEAIVEPVDATTEAPDELTETILRVKSKITPDMNWLDIDALAIKEHHKLSTEYFASRCDFDPGPGDDFRKAVLAP
jgi:hypothetical protein